MFKKIVLISSIICCLLGYLFTTNKQSIASEETQNLMIVAHPDDETIFGGHEILNNHYFIVCLTNGDNPTRKAEFEKMLKESNNEGIILSYPDKVNGERSNWSTCIEEMKETINYYLQLRSWNKIVTHNPNGEYGHNQHILTNTLVTDKVLSLNQENMLYYFAPYFKKNEATPANKTMNKREENDKKQLAGIYQSQQKTINKLSHIFGYENLIAYTDKDNVFS
ncbi:MAG: PIG-L family deacetylase [Coprobacillaceae bacterium]